MKPLIPARLTWLAAALAAGCTQAPQSGSAPGASRTHAVAMAPPVETTFEAIPSADDLIARVRALATEAIDEQAMAEVKAELATYRYQPAAQPEPDLVPETPRGRSFLEEAMTATAEVAQLEGGAMEVCCTMRPCILRADFDGDGRQDVAMQIAGKDNNLQGVGFLLTGRPGQVLAAGLPSDLGDDLVWAESWRVAPSTASLSESEAAAAPGASGAILVMVGSEQRGVAFFGAPLKPGAGALLRSALVTGGVVE